MENRIRKLRDTTSMVNPGPQSAGLWVDSANQLKYSSSVSGVDTAFQVSRTLRNSETTTATNVLAASETGLVSFLSAATEFVTTLPAPAAGLEFEFIVSAAPSGANYTVVTNGSANIIKGHVLTSQDAGGTADSETSGGDTVSFVSAKAVAGDRARFISDGTSWFVVATCAVFDAITITTAT
jgi:hypothetical protein